MKSAAERTGTGTASSIAALIVHPSPESRNVSRALRESGKNLARPAAAVQGPTRSPPRAATAPRCRAQRVRTGNAPDPVWRGLWRGCMFPSSDMAPFKMRVLRLRCLSVLMPLCTIVTKWPAPWTLMQVPIRRAIMSLPSGVPHVPPPATTPRRSDRYADDILFNLTNHQQYAFPAPTHTCSDGEEWIFRGRSFPRRSHHVIGVAASIKCRQPARLGDRYRSSRLRRTISQMARGLSRLLRMTRAGAHCLLPHQPLPLFGDLSTTAQW